LQKKKGRRINPKLPNSEHSGVTLLTRLREIGKKWAWKKTAKGHPPGTERDDTEGKRLARGENLQKWELGRSITQGEKGKKGGAVVLEGARRSPGLATAVPRGGKISFQISQRGASHARSPGDNLRKIDLANYVIESRRLRMDGSSKCKVLGGRVSTVLTRGSRGLSDKSKTIKGGSDLEEEI